MKQPFFSIVIPVYNRWVILEQRIQYLLNQTFKDFEVIIVDDGSLEIIPESFQNLIVRNASIKLIAQENLERGAARNKGIKAANGEYIVLFDSDDYMHENHLEVLYNGILKNNYPYFIATKFNFKDENGKIFASEISNFKPGRYNYKLFLNGNPLACNICFKKCNNELILFEEDRKYSIKEDWMFLIGNLKKHEMILLDDTSISMYDHQNRSMKSNNNLIISHTKNAIDWIKSNLSLNKSELRKLQAHENYFCGIHSYLDDQNISAIKYTLNAIKNGGIKIKYIILILKSIVGRKFILKIKK